MSNNQFTVRAAEERFGVIPAALKILDVPC
jgi:hypothetical protein